MSIPELDQVAIGRFWARVEKTDRCWYWLQYERWARGKPLVRARGYGTFKAGDKAYAPHKLAYLLAKGNVPKGLVVRHRCGDSRCVNPEHLLLGSQSDNARDMWFHRANPGQLVPETWNQQDAMDDEWMELADASRLLGRTERQVLRYAQSGKVATRRVGRRYQYRRDDVEQLAGQLEATDAPRHDNVGPDVGKALIEVLAAQREVIQLQRDLMTAREEIATLRAAYDKEQRKSARYWGIIQKLVKK